MKKKIKSLLILGCLGLLVIPTSCGVKGNDHIIFYHTMGNLKRKNLDKCVEEFNETYKGKYVVEAVAKAGSYNDLATILKQQIPAGTNPTMAWGYPDSFSSYIGQNNGRNNALVDLSQFIEDPELGFGNDGTEGLDDFVKQYYNEGTNYQIDGIYSMPFYKSTEVLYYNADYFNGDNPLNKKYDVPETWEQAVALSKQMVEDRKAAGVVSDAFVPLAYDSDANLFITQCVQKDIPYTVLPKDENTNPFAFKNDKAIALVDELSTLIKDGYLITKGVLPNNAYTSTYFQEEKCVMTIGSTGGSDYNVSSNFTVGVAPAPYSNGKKTYVMQGPSVCIFKNDKEENIKGAWEFYKFLSSTKWNTLLSLENSYDPVRYSCYETPEYKTHIGKAENGVLKSQISAITANLKETYFTTPVFPGSDIAREQVGGLMSRVIHQKMTAEEAINDAYQNCIISQ